MALKIRSVTHCGSSERFAFLLWLGLIAALTLPATAAPPAPAAPAAPPHRPGVCLVLSGGAALGFAHVGVLKQLDEMGLRPSCIIGTSAGSLVGSMYAAGMSAVEIERYLSEISYKDIVSDRPDRGLLNYDEKSNPNPPSISLQFNKGAFNMPEGMMEGQRVTKELELVFTRLGVVDVTDFDHLPIPFRAVAVDMKTNQEHHFASGRLAVAVRASIAIPFVFSPVRINDMILVDGGVLNNVAVEMARTMGFDKVIAVNVSRPSPPEKKQLNNMFEIMFESFSMARLERDRRELAMADLVIEPDLFDFALSDFTRYKELIQRGYETSKSMKDRIAEVFKDMPMPVKPQPAWHYVGKLESVTIAGVEGGWAKDALNRADLEKGDVVTVDALNKSVEQIYAMNRFRRVDYAFAYQDGRGRLQFLVDQKPRRELDFSLHFDNDYYFTGFARYRSRNLLNTNMDLGVKLLAGYLKDFRLNLTYPFHVGTGFSLTAEGYYTSIPHDIYEDKDPVENYRENHSGFKVGTTLSLGNNVGLYGAFNLEKLTIKSLGWFNAKDDTATSFFTAGLGIDTLDKWDFPEKGLQFDAHLEKHFLWFDDGMECTKLSTSADVYLPITSRWTVHASGTAGWGWDTPPYLQFYAGGQNLMNFAAAPMPGYRNDELYGRDLWTGGLEVRRKFEKDALGIVDASYLYVRYGVAGARLPEFDGQEIITDTPFQFFHGAGIGYAMATRFGPVRLFIGMGEQGRIRWSLGIGPEF